MGYDFEILYKTKSTNRVADALSHKGEGGGEEEKESRVVARPYWKNFQEVLREVEEDEVLMKVIKDI